MANLGGNRPGRGEVDLAVVVNGFPRLSETFVLHELLELERHGLRLHVIALRDPAESIKQEALDRLQAEVEYLPVIGEGAPKLAVRAAHAALFLRRPSTYLNGVAEAIASPDFSRTTLRRAALLAHRLVRLGMPPIYVHFAHKPATLARFASLLTGAPYGLSAHAKDIWLTPERELARKVRDASVVLTCTAEGQRHLERLAGGRTAVRLVYHGVDTTRAPARRAPADEPVVLTVGRLVEKKGHDLLLRAAALVSDRGHAFRLRIAGEGDEWPRLQRLVHELGLDRQVTFLGPLSEAEVAREYTNADVFALACRELENGDRDGVPNVLLELFRRLTSYFDGGGVGLDAFLPWLAATKEQVLDLTTGNFTHLDNMLALKNGKLRMTVRPEQLVIVGAKTTNTKIAPGWPIDVSADEGARGEACGAGRLGRSPLLVRATQRHHAGGVALRVIADSLNHKVADGLGR